MKLSEFIEKHGDRQIEEMELKEVLQMTNAEWFPKEDERYYYLDLMGRTRTDVYSYEGDYGKAVIRHNRVFRTEEESEFEAERVKFKRFMEREFARNSEPLDWDDDDQSKYYFVYDHHWGQIQINQTYKVVQQGTIYTTNGEGLLEFINEHEDEIELYCFGVGR